MRAGDSYKLRMMAETKEPLKAILERFKYDYPEAEIMKFIPKGYVGGVEAPVVEVVSLADASTVPQLKAALTAAGVEFTAEDKKADLETLRDLTLEEGEGRVDPLG